MAAVESGLPEVQQEQFEALRIRIKNEGAGIVLEDELRQSPAKRHVSIKEMLAQPWLDDMELWEKASIRRIPQYLKDGQDKDYDPQIVSLGPYHHGKEHLRPMDQHKLRCFRHILKRSNHEIDRYLDSVEEAEERARICYEETIFMDSDDFVQMMVLDGCFMLELFLGFYLGFDTLGYHWSDPIFSMQRSMHTIQHDMILLENQIPLFILDRLLPLFKLDQLPDRRIDHIDQDKLVAKLALHFLKSPQPTIFLLNKFNLVNGLEIDTLSSRDEIHCLILFWLSIKPTEHKRMRSSQSRHEMIPCVMELWKAGIEFSMRLTMRRMDTFMDIQFKKGTLKIPQLEIHDRTRSFFLNLIAFERSRYGCRKYVASYVIFMANLIRSPEDVGYLCQRGIIKNRLGSKAEVVALFHQLSLGVVLDTRDNDLAGLWEEVHVYYSRSCYPSVASLMLKFNIGRAQLKHRCIYWASIFKQNYFSNPWSFISLVAACVLLVLTCIQTFYTVYGYYRPRF